MVRHIIMAILLYIIFIMVIIFIHIDIIIFGDFIDIQDHYHHQGIIIEDHHYHITIMGIDILETIRNLQEITECRDQADLHIMIDQQEIQQDIILVAEDKENGELNALHYC